jgi:hypothetical protein
MGTCGTLHKHPQKWIHSGYNEIQKRLGIRFKGRKIIEDEDDYLLRDRQAQYGDETQNLFYWDLGSEPSIP